jgi:uncharacterized membrane protein required for colicin V production
MNGWKIGKTGGEEKHQESGAVFRGRGWFRPGWDRWLIGRVKLPIRWCMDFTFSWVDLITVLVLVIGFVRGRKRGLSEEFLDVLQWGVIVTLSILFYRPVGDFMNQQRLVSQAMSYVFSILTIALVVKMIFSLFKRQLGQKIIDGDVFGRFEYYLGMLAGMVRWSCMYFLVLSMLHAPHYTKEYRVAKAKSDDYNWGTSIFPSVMSIQEEVFTRSLTGRNAEKYLASVLIAPSSIDSNQLRDDNSMGRRREREVDQLMRGR